MESKIITYQQGFTEFEKQMINKEFESLFRARGESPAQRTEIAKEWQSGFIELGLTANEICKRIRKIKHTHVYNRLKLADFMAVDISDDENIIYQMKNENRNYFRMCIICDMCNSVWAIAYVKDVYTWRGDYHCIHFNNPFHITNPNCPNIIKHEILKEMADSCSYDLQEFRF